MGEEDGRDVVIASQWDFFFSSQIYIMFLKLYKYTINIQVYINIYSPILCILVSYT
jgi:hypothetical protein